MSCQKGSNTRQRPQKYKNRTAFKNNLHDTSQKTKMINNLQVVDVCARCKEIIEWKIKYKKYKPLTQPKTCVVCKQKTVKRAYHDMCIECGKLTGKCTKCCKLKEVLEVTKDEKPFTVDREMRFIIKELHERRRRTFYRYMERKKQENLGEDELRDDLLKKLESLKLMDKDDDDDDFAFSDDDFASNDPRSSENEDLSDDDSSSEKVNKDIS